MSEVKCQEIKGGEAAEDPGGETQAGNSSSLPLPLVSVPIAARRFVLLDRDGTLIVERHYLSHPDQVELLPGAIAGLRQMRQLGLGLVVVTNQSGIGRGFFDQARLEAVHSRLQQLLAAAGIRLDGIFYCPHTPADRCSCRKPEPGLVQQAAATFGFQPSDCFVIGDKPCDIELGQRVKATTLLVKTGYGATVVANDTIRPDFVVEDLAAAAQKIRGLLPNVGNRIA